MYLFYCDDSLARYGFEPVQKLRTRLNRFKPLVILHYLPFQCGSSDVVLYVGCFGVSFCSLHLDSLVVTFSVRSVNRMFFLHFVYFQFW